MKFSDGYWHMREGVRPLYPAQVHDHTADRDSLTVYAPTKRLEHRGDTLNRPLVTVRAESPMPDVIGLTVSHFAGGVSRGPSFELSGVDGAASVDGLTLTSGSLSVRFQRDPWRVEFVAGGKVLTSSGYKAMALIEDGGHHYVREQLTLGVGACVYGLGERFGAFVKNGQTVDIWNADGGTSSEQAYKNVPFFLTNAGYGVFVDHPGLVSYEVGSEAVSRVQFSVEGQALRYFVIHGPTPKEILRKYTALTGRPALPPPWSFGLWLTTSFTTSYDEQTVTSFVDGMAARDIPLSVFHFDTFWMREFHWCDFEWDPRTFPDPRGMLKRLRERGLRISLWINPYIAQRSALFAEGSAAGFLVRTPDGGVWQTDKWQAGMGLVDFTNPAARRWYADKLRAQLDLGVDCFKSDFGERIPTDVVWHDGSDPERMHNYYTHLYNETVFELLREHRGEAEAVLYARSATAGGQKFPVHWGGDSESTLESMAESLRGGLSLSMSGFGFWSHDIGGFEGRPDPAVFKRWIPFGLLSSHSRLHGNQSYRVPWLFDDEAVDVLRAFTRLKNRLMPYLFASAVTAHREGVPVMRPMVAEFPDDPACTHLDRQYMLGDGLLVAPVFSTSGETAYYVPAGRWTHLLTGEVVEGPRWVREVCGFDMVPVYVRPGTALAWGARDDRPDYDYADGVTLRLFDVETETAVEIPAADGTTVATFTVGPAGVRRSGPAAAWRIEAAGHPPVDLPAGTKSWQS
ncbi:alpha-xylosidase [Phytohabitans houttuyneae]|uniref:alpha-D-xyloside xylohydrolase n=1 Tax=Phytohabitans houttuyneae TaxID=1076126 RepID=A0A6V8KFS2_9ACTN|nr:alpha-xylosidase [Phytohabitans houttuyneae]GFJ84083.1 alpha-xylosidase [Phytohabitans houttuyneae]